MVFSLVLSPLAVVLFSASFQLRPHSKQHGPEAGGASDKVGYGLCHQYALGSHSEYSGQYDDKGYDNDNLAENGKNTAFLDFPSPTNTDWPAN